MLPVIEERLRGREGEVDTNEVGYLEEIRGEEWKNPELWRERCGEESVGRRDMRASRGEGMRRERGVTFRFCGRR